MWPAGLLLEAHITLKISSTPLKIVKVMPFFRTEDGCRLYYESIGGTPRKPFLVFLNGTFQNTFHWIRQVRHFQHRYNIVLYECRAQGRSGIGNKKLGIDVHAADLVALLEYLKIAKAVFVGISHGARVALETAGRYPQCVTQLVLCSTTATLNNRTRATLTLWKDILATRGVEATAWTILPTVLGQNYLADYQKTLPKMVKAIALRNRPESLRAHLEAMLAYPPPSLSSAKTGWPALVISGATDPLVPSEEARDLANQVSGVYVLIDNVGHTIQLEAPSRFNNELDAFLIQNDH